MPLSLRQAVIVARILAAVEKKGGGWSKQPRAPAGSPIGGQWVPKGMSFGAAGMVAIDPAEALAVSKNKNNHVYAKKLEAINAAVAAGDLDALAKVKTYNSTHYNNGEKVVNQAHKLATMTLEGKAADKGSDGGPVKLSSMTKVAPKPGGSAAGAIYQDADGQKWLVKSYASSDQAQNEVLASKLYAAAGAKSADMQLVDLEGQYNGGLGVASKWNDNLVAMNPGDKLHKAVAQQDFAADAWLANWDTVGLSYDNLAVDGGKVSRIDPGGALLYRAQGTPKGEAFGTTVGEWDTLRDPTVNAQAAKVFGDMPASKLISSADKVAKVDNDTILALVDKYGPGTEGQKAALAAKLIARREDVTAKANALKAATTTPAESAAITPAAAGKAKLTYDELDDLSDSFDWTMFGAMKDGPKIAGDMLDAAEKGDLAALKAIDTKGNIGLDTAKAKTINALEAKVKAAAPAPSKAADAIPAGAVKLDGMDTYGMAIDTGADLVAMKSDAASAAYSAMTEAAHAGDLKALDAVDALGDSKLTQYKAKIAVALKHKAKAAGIIPAKTTPAPKADDTTPPKFTGPNAKLWTKAAEEAKASYDAGSNSGLYMSALVGDGKTSASAKAFNAYVKGLQDKLAGKTDAPAADPIPTVKAGPPAAPHIPGGKYAWVQKKIAKTQGLLDAGDTAGIAKLKPYGATKLAPAEVAYNKWLGDVKAHLGAGGTTAAIPKATVAPKAKAVPKFDPGKVEKPPAFTKSSKPAVNKANADAAEAIYAAALTGDPKALADVKFQPVDPATGAPSGAPLPMAQHPSSSVKAYWQTTKEDLNNQLHPPEPAPTFEASGPLAQKLTALGAAVKPLKSPDYVTNKVGYYPVVGQVDTPSAYAGAGKLFSNSSATAHYAAFDKLPQSERANVKHYTGSGYSAINKSFRSGAPNATAQSAAKGVAAAAQELPAGTLLSRKVSFDSAHIDQLVSGGEGKILQEFGLSSTSINPNTWSGNVQFRITTAPGAKGLYMGSKSAHPGEKEMVLPVNARMLVTKVTPKSAVPAADKMKGWGTESSYLVDVVLLPEVL